MEDVNIITQDTEIEDISKKAIKVDNGATLSIRGMHTNELFICKNSSVIIHGIVNGNIINQGVCNIFGVVHGELIEQGGQFILDDGCLINPE